MKAKRTFGLWPSAFSAKMMSAGKSFQSVGWNGDGDVVVWREGRSGHGVLVAHGFDGDASKDLTADLNVKAKVGYGGGDFAVHGSGVSFFADDMLYILDLSQGRPKPIGIRFGHGASPVITADGKWAAYVHHEPSDRRDTVVVVPTSGEQWPQVICSGRDFYTQPRWSSDGRRFAYVTWDHPHMPWDDSCIEVANVNHSANRAPVLSETVKLFVDQSCAVFQPEFCPVSDRLFFLSDRSGDWQPWVCDLVNGDTRQMASCEGQLGGPNWIQDMRCYGVEPDGKALIAVLNNRGISSIVRIEVESGEVQTIAGLDCYQEIDQISVAPKGRRIAFIGSSPTQPRRVVAHDLNTKETRIVARAGAEVDWGADLAKAEAIDWSVGGQSSDGQKVYGLYYPPASSRFEGIGLPPLIVLIHGGPTSQARAGWSPRAQFFATRGYAVLFVNHRGSTGYGREYQDLLKGNWGVYDVEDAISGALALADRGLVDRRKMVIMGGSAGGFTVLQTMATRPDVFAAGISLYGIANQFTLAAGTHKFEERYLDSLLGPLPESADIYRERSPIFQADKIKNPIAIFQGAEDKVVPKGQADALVAALKQNQTPHVYHVYEGEGHGWRKNETVLAFYKAVEDFLQQYVIFS